MVKGRRAAKEFNARGRRTKPACQQVDQNNEPLSIERVPSQTPRRDISAFLPEEIRAMICQLLPREDLQSLRTVSKVWKNTTSRTLFETIHLRPTRSSFGNLSALSTVASYRELVKTIDYDGNTIATAPAELGLDNWGLCCAATGFGLESTGRHQFLKQFTRKRLRKYYEQYRQYGLGQDEAFRLVKEERWLVRALQLYPAIHSMRFSAKHKGHEDTAMGVPSLDSLSSIAQEILVEPGYNLGYESEEQFWNLLQSLCEGGRSDYLQSVHAKVLDLDLWDELAPSLECHKQLTTLHDLSLEFAVSESGRCSTTTLREMIEHTPLLQSLHLHFGFSNFHAVFWEIRLPDIISDRAHLEVLKNLSLTAIETTESRLRNLMRRLSGTLLFLELSDILFQQAEAPDEYGKGSWIRFIVFLAKEMSLTQVHFSGLLTNGWDEGWVVRSGKDREAGQDYVDQPRTSDKECLKYQIERYVTKGAQNPFTAKSQNKASDYTSSLLDKLDWEVKKDDSWRFEERLPGLT